MDNPVSPPTASLSAVDDPVEGGGINAALIHVIHRTHSMHIAST